MVARDKHAETAPRRSSGAITALMRTWRRLLSRSADTAARAVEHSGRSMRDVGGTLASDEPRKLTSPVALVAAGAAAVVLGAVGRVAVAAALSEPLAPAASGALAAAVWVTARYIIFDVLARTSPRIARRTVTFAWARSAVPYLIAVTGLLRGVAFAASALIAYRSLVASDVAPRRAASICGWAYGGEIVAALVTWIVANGLIVLPFL